MKFAILLVSIVVTVLAGCSHGKNSSSSNLQASSNSAPTQATPLDFDKLSPQDALKAKYKSAQFICKTFVRGSIGKNALGFDQDEKVIDLLAAPQLPQTLALHAEAGNLSADVNINVGNLRLIDTTLETNTVGSYRMLHSPALDIKTDSYVVLSHPNEGPVWSQGNSESTINENVLFAVDNEASSNPEDLNPPGAYTGCVIKTEAKPEFMDQWKQTAMAIPSQKCAPGRIDAFIGCLSF